MKFTRREMDLMLYAFMVGALAACLLFMALMPKGAVP